MVLLNDKILPSSQDTVGLPTWTANVLFSLEYICKLGCRKRLPVQARNSFKSLSYRHKCVCMYVQNSIYGQIIFVSPIYDFKVSWERLFTVGKLNSYNRLRAM